jgi:hypothetical protein
VESVVGIGGSERRNRRTGPTGERGCTTTGRRCDVAMYGVTAVVVEERRRVVPVEGVASDRQNWPTDVAALEATGRCR